MSNRTFTLEEPLYQYLLSVSLREPDLLRELREETRQLSNAGMQIAPEQGQFMAFLAQLIGARKCIEVGTFTGYSALCVAMSLPADGKLVVPGVKTTPRNARLLAGGSVTVSTGSDGLIVQLPARAPDPIDSVIALEQ